MWEVNMTPNVKVSPSVSHQQSLVCSHLHEPWVYRVLNSSISFCWLKRVAYEFTFEGEHASFDSLVCLPRTKHETDCWDRLFLGRRKGNEVVSYLHNCLSTALKQPRGQRSSHSYVQCSSPFLRGSELHWNNPCDYSASWEVIPVVSLPWHEGKVLAKPEKMYRNTANLASHLDYSKSIRPD